MILRWSSPLKAYTGTCFGPNRDHSGSEACSKSQSFHCQQGRALSIELLWTYKLLCRRLTSEFGLNRLHISLILLLTICKCDISAQGYFTIRSTNCMSWQFIEYVFSWWWRYSINMFSHLVLIYCQVCCTLLELQLIEYRLHVWYLSWKIFSEWISEVIPTPPLWGDLCYKEASIAQIKVWTHEFTRCDFLLRCPLGFVATPVFHFAFILLYVLYQLRSDNVFDWSWCAQLIILCRRRVKRLFMF